MPRKSTAKTQNTEPQPKVIEGMTQPVDPIEEPGLRSIATETANEPTKTEVKEAQKSHIETRTHRGREYKWDTQLNGPVVDIDPTPAEFSKRRIREQKMAQKTADEK